MIENREVISFVPKHPLDPPIIIKRRNPRLALLGSLLIAAVLLVALSGCSAGTATRAAVVPVTGSNARFEVHEYAIVEESSDNPTHPEFQQRAQAAVAAQQAARGLSNPGTSVQEPNAALASFDYRLAANPTPPFSAYALYHNQNLIARDIARIWPIALKDSDFFLGFETLDGQRLVASLTGIRPWSAQAQDSGTASGSVAPVSYGDLLAYAQSNASASGLYNLSLAGLDAQHTASPVAWSNAHWALDAQSHVLRDGVDLNAALGYQSVFQWRGIANQPFYFFIKDGVTRLAYAGQDLRYSYDRVVNSGSPRFTPGDNGRIVWFYALRDGVWYYVEAGLF